MRRLVESARVAHLATVGEHGHPHIVPICFALDGDTLFFAVDSKPKRTRDLMRLRNIAAHASVAVLVDHYEDVWARLWWVRMDGTARILAAGPEQERALDLLAQRYPQYVRTRPAGPAVAMEIGGMTGWSAS